MKILITSDWYIPAVNGVVTSIINLERELTSRGHEVMILTLSQSIHTKKNSQILSLGSVSAKVFYPGARLRVASSKKIMEEIIEWQPDIVHSQCEFNTFVLARKIAKKLDIPLIHTYHTVYEDYTHYFSPSYTWGKTMMSKFTKYLSGRCDCMIAPTEKVKKLLLKYKVSCPVDIVPTGIDLSTYQRHLPDEEKAMLRREIGIPENAKVGLFVGRLAKEKNLPELFNLWNSANTENAVFLVVGGGPYNDELREIVSSMDMKGKILFTGMVSPDQVWKYYKLGDFFLNASNSETQGLTYIEALASGLPLLCKKDSCLDDVIINGVNGWQYTSDEDFLEKLKLLLSDSTSVVFSKHNITATVHKFSTAVFADKIEAIYEGRTQWREIS